MTASMSHVTRMDQYACVTWQLHMCELSPSCVWHTHIKDSFMCVTRLALICVKNLTVCIYIRIYIYTYICTYIHTDESFLTQTSPVTLLLDDKFHWWQVSRDATLFPLSLPILRSLCLCQFCVSCDATKFSLSLSIFCPRSLCQICALCDPT